MDDSSEDEQQGDERGRRAPYMAYLYMVSDVHGELDALEAALGAMDLTRLGNRLVLLGDYVPHQRSDEDLSQWMARCGSALCRVRALQDEHPGRVDVLAGNWERWILDLVDDGEVAVEDGLLRWLRGLPCMLETDAQVLVHAGIDEEAGEWWRWGTDDAFLCQKWPPTFGAFEKDVVAGHVGTSSIADDESFHGVFWDGTSHYYIDGTTEESGVLPVLRYETGSGTYCQALATRDGGVCPWRPIEAMEPRGF